MERRRRVLQLEQQIRRAADARSASGRADVTLLRAALARCPCPHWDMETSDNGHGSWRCLTCDDVISPMWVPVSEQERSLRHAARQRSAHQLNW